MSCDQCGNKDCTCSKQIKGKSCGPACCQNIRISRDGDKTIIETGDCCGVIISKNNGRISRITYDGGSVEFLRTQGDGRITNIALNCD